MRPKNLCQLKGSPHSFRNNFGTISAQDPQLHAAACQSSQVLFPPKLISAPPAPLYLFKEHPKVKKRKDILASPHIVPNGSATFNAASQT